MLRRFVCLESPSDDPAATERMGEAALAALTRGARSVLAGASVSRIPNPEGSGPRRGPQIRVRIPGIRPEARTLLLLGHLDTVWPRGTLRELPWRVEGRVARGPGIYDMKAGLVQTIWALRALDRLGRRPSRPLVVVWNSDEEIGSAASRSLIESEARSAAACLVMEPSLRGGAVKTSRRGVGLLTVRVKGLAAHAGLDPERGVSAIRELARIVLAASELSAPERGFTVSVGLIRGGSRTNVVPAEAEAHLDVRMDDPAVGQELIEAIRRLGPHDPRARVRWTGGVDRPPLVRGEGVRGLYRQARMLAAALDWELGEGAAGGASDGNIVAGLGVPVLDGLGPRGDGAHARTEQVDLDDLPRRAALLAALVARL